jgi:ABC-type sugar transport system permease subunit
MIIWQLQMIQYQLRFGYGAAMSFFMGVISLLLSWIVFVSLKTERA